MVGCEEAALYSERHDGCRCRDGAENQVHHRRLDEHGVKRFHAREDQPGHSARKYDEPDRFGRFDLGDQRGAQRGADVWFRGFACGLTEREARLDFVAFVPQFVDETPPDQDGSGEGVSHHETGQWDERSNVEVENAEAEQHAECQHCRATKSNER